MDAAPYNFDNPGELAKSLRGAAVLLNTYWVRFAHGQVDFDQAVKNTLTLLRAARRFTPWRNWSGSSARWWAAGP